MLAAVQHAEALLRASEAKGRSLSFAFVVPTWELLPFHVQVTARVRVSVGVGVRARVSTLRRTIPNPDPNPNHLRRGREHREAFEGGDQVCGAPEHGEHAQQPRPGWG